MQRRKRIDAAGRPKADYIARWRDAGRERQKRFARKIDADRFIATLEADLLRGIWIDPIHGRTPLRIEAEAWFRTASPLLKPKTAASYRSLLDSRLLPALGHIPIGELRRAAVQSWINEMVCEGLSPSRIRQAHVVLRLLLQGAFLESRTATNAAVGIRLPKIERREAPYWEPAIVTRIIRACPSPYDSFLAVQGKLGLRFGEAAALRSDSIQPARSDRGARLKIDRALEEIGGRLHLGSTKSHAMRAVPLPGFLEKQLTQISLERDETGMLFLAPRGGPLRYANFRNTVWIPLLDRLAIPRTGMHILRHSAAAAMINDGADPKTVQVILGHSSAAFTLTVYGHVFDTNLDAVAQRMNVDMP
ncbi:MAG: site-specific integrase [Actinomycetota bacterium]